MKNHIIFVVILAIIVFGINTARAQDTLGQQAYAILENKCLNCHGTGGVFTENLLIQDRDQLIVSGSVVPNDPNASELYLRLISTDTAKRMPLNQPALSDNAIAIIRDWITQGAPDWEENGPDFDEFITTDTMLDTIKAHLATLETYERPYARYFSLTHLYNADENKNPEKLQAYRNALSKLVNSLSWGHDIIKPHPINSQQTLLYIDLRYYEWDEWDTRDDVWKRIEQDYPYTIEFNPETEADQFEKLAQLRQDTGSNVPFIHADWFLATASLPPLYHDILRLPDTDLTLEQQLNINVARNIQQSPGIRVSRAGIVDSGVSTNNRVVERHTSVYGAYWKSYDFAGSIGAQNILTHPLSFKHDGGEIVFNLPNGLQAYYISDAKGNRIDKAPTDIVSNPAAKDTAVRNGLSCIGCHTKGMKTFEDVMRTNIELTENPNYDKTQALRLYVGQDKMDKLLEQDTEKYRQALVKATGDGFEDIEPVHRAHEVFVQPLDAAYAAAVLGLETAAFVQQIQDKQSLQNLGLTTLLGGGTINRDTWTEKFADIVAAINSDDSTVDTPPPTPPTPIGNVAYIPDPNLLTAIAAALGKPNASTITITEMETLTILIADDAGIRDLTGLEKATKLQRIELRRNAITDLTPLTELIRLNNIKLRGNNITDVSPLANLKSLDWLGLEETNITDLSPLSGLVRLKGIGIEDTPVTDLSPLAKLPSLERIVAWKTSIRSFSTLATADRLKYLFISSNNKNITDLNALSNLKRLKQLDIGDSSIMNLEALSELTQLETLKLWGNKISNLLPLRNLKNLKNLELQANLISDLTPLAELTQLKQLNLEQNIISDVSPLANLTNLTYLDLRENAIADFSPLEGLSEKLFIRSENNPGVFLQGGPKIVGPWLWILFPETPYDDFHNKDLLAEASQGTVTEQKIATNGAIVGDAVGDYIWAAQKITSTQGNNITQTLTTLGTPAAHDKENVVYGCITLHSPQTQETQMFAGSGANHKIWLNGKLVNRRNGWAEDYQELFPVTLKQGKNVLLVSIHNWNHGLRGYFGFAPETEYTVRSDDRFSLFTETTDFTVGSTFTIDLKVTDVSDLAGWQSDIHFDPKILKVNSVREGIFLKQNAGRTHFRHGVIHNTAGRINGISSTRLTQGGVDGEGTLLSVTFIIINAGETQVTLHGFVAGTSTGETITANPTGISVGVKKIKPTDSNVDYVFSKTPIYAGQTFILDIRAKEVYNMAGWQFNINYDPAVLEAVDVNEGDFLKANDGMTFFQAGTIDNTDGKITGLNAISFNKDGATGTGTLLSVTFLAKTEGKTQLTLNNLQFGSVTGETIPAGPLEVSITIGEQFADEDVNRDGEISILDMILVATNIGGDAADAPRADVNNDGVINIQDLILVAQHIGNFNVSASPSSMEIDGLELNPAMIQAWIKQALLEDDGSLAFRLGIGNLQKLLASLVPEKTALLANYPNPFNPETWIPYQLAKSADVTLTIYAADGTVVRILALGHQNAGMYQSQNRAAYWDGRNTCGEPVASNVYFYTLNAGGFTATRKMLILK